jgi:hypothetical protein
MTEIKAEPRPPIPAIMRLRAKYGKHHGLIRRKALAKRADKIRRSQQMGLFKKPTMGDRMDNAAQKKWWNSKSDIEQHMTKADAAAYENAVRREKHSHEQAKPYRGSKTEADHKRGFFR